MKNLIPFVLFSLLAFTVKAQTSYTVDNTTGSGADFISLQAAIDAANSGDTLLVHSSPTSYGNVDVNKTLYILGSGHNPNANSNFETTTVGVFFLVGNCPSVVINGIELSQVRCGTPYVDISNITIRNCKISSYIQGEDDPNVLDWIIEGNVFNGGYLYNNYSYNWLVRNNIFYSSWYSMYYFNSSTTFTNNLFICANNNLFLYCNNPTFNNNIFFVTGSSTGIGFDNSSITANNNLTFGGNGAEVNDLPGDNNLNNVDPMFESANNSNISSYYSSDYHPGTGSPLVDAATDGGDIGLYGGNFGYHPDGKASNFPYMLNLDIQNPSVEAGELLNVIFSAQKNQ
jgi:hypothetical protein